MEDPEAKAAQEHLQQIFHDKLFTDFTIKAGDQTFPVHRAVLNQCSYFRGMLKHDFVETRTDELSLPESPEMVEAILKHIYGFPMSEVMPASKKIVDLIMLHTVADKYSLPILVERTYMQWIERFNNVNLLLTPTSVHLARVFKTMDQPTIKTDVFEKFVINHILEHHWTSGVPRTMVMALFAANPGLTEDTLLEYISRESPKSRDPVPVPATVWKILKKKSFESKCPCCHKSWGWQKFDLDLELACPYCATKHSWVDYVL